jgi:hypothetical protein
LGDLSGETEREFLILTGATAQVRYIESMLPQEDTHPLLSHCDICALELILKTARVFVTAKLLLS